MPVGDPRSEVNAMDKIMEITGTLKALYGTRCDQFMVWYGQLDELAQFGVIAVAIFIAFCTMVFCVLSRTVRR